MNQITELIEYIGQQQHFFYLLLALAANVIVKYAAVLKSGDFRLAFVADWLHTRLLPLFLGYGAAALLARAMQQPLLEQAAFAAILAAYAGYVFSALQDLFGLHLPAILTGNTDEDD